MAEDLLALAVELRRRGEAFALATVVRCERPTSAKPGARALIRADGTVTGWIGGACAEPTVVREALNSLHDGQPRFVSLVGEGARAPGRTEGIVEYRMTCHSGGTLEVYVEPHLPRPLLLLVGHGPVLDTLARLGQAIDLEVLVAQVASAMASVVAGRAWNPRTSIVVASHSDDDEAALLEALATPATYVSLVASRKRAAAVVDNLRRRGVPPDRLGELKAPAGLDLGAVTPDEIAISILAEIVQFCRSPKIVAPSAAAADAVDPICGMSVDIASARYRLPTPQGLVYFCCRQCQETFEQTLAR